MSLKNNFNSMIGTTGQQVNNSNLKFRQCNVAGIFEGSLEKWAGYYHNFTGRTLVSKRNSPSQSMKQKMDRGALGDLALRLLYVSPPQDFVLCLLCQSRAYWVFALSYPPQTLYSNDKGRGTKRSKRLHATNSHPTRSSFFLTPQPCSSPKTSFTSLILC